MKNNRTIWYFGGGAVLILAIIFIALTGNSAPVIAADAVIYKDMNCGCCGIYANYASKSMSVQVNDQSDVTAFKDKLEIPEQLRSCHTTMIEGYFVEGHVPMEAIEKLLEERPDIKGIALPGMPSGTPGMPGPKREPWVISAVHNDGSVTEFMTI